MNLGIIQGRLTPTESGFVQEFPNNWQKEFFLIGTLGLNHIEYICLDKVIYQKDVKYHSSKISSVCFDYITKININELNHKDLFNLLNIFINSCRLNNIFAVTLPFLDRASLKDDISKEVINVIIDLAEKNRDFIISLETDLGINALFELVSSSDNLFITYDTGNINFAGLYHDEYIQKLHSKFFNVHLKDRHKNGISYVPLPWHTSVSNQDAVSFQSIFESLHKIKYEGYFTLQCARNNQMSEVQYVKELIRFFKQTWSDAK